MAYLEFVHNPEDLKKIDLAELPSLCDETRDFLISSILVNGGHFAGNLGVVELSIALHYVFNSPSDKIIWDVGHQSYIHKILTGRKDLLSSIRSFYGISGFPKMSESVHDAFGTGHSSTAISAACGMGVACKLKNEIHRKIIAVVGDGALTGGMSFEALNNLALDQTNVLVIINDNHIGIDPNNGALDKHLQEIENSKSNFFQNLGLDYSGPFDGHNVIQLIETLRFLQTKTTPHVLHIRTTKGKGYPPAEAEQTRWHSTNKYVKIGSDVQVDAKKWQDVFADSLDILAATHSNIVGVTPAMPSGSGMAPLMVKYPDRFFDVGIAEQHAVTFSAGLATEGFVPYLNIYSTFLQRGYDQLIHDVALQGLPVVFCIDRAGLVGEDGPTHHGVFDIAFLRTVPNMMITAPRNESEFRTLMQFAYSSGKPFAIRYPKGKINSEPDNDKQPAKKILEPIALKKGIHTAVVATGIASNFAIEAIQTSRANVSLYHFPCIKPLDTVALDKIFRQYSRIITVEDGAITGGFGEGIAAYAMHANYHSAMVHLGIPDMFIGQGDNRLLYDACGYGPEKIAALLQQTQTD